MGQGLRKKELRRRWQKRRKRLKQRLKEQIEGARKNKAQSSPKPPESA